MENENKNTEEKTTSLKKHESSHQGSLLSLNRISELEGLKATGIIDHDKKKQRNQNAFYGKVPMIDLIDCEKWIKDNKDDWQKEMDRIDNFVKKLSGKSVS